MSAYKLLRGLGWDGDPKVAPERHSHIVSLFQLSQYFEFKIIGMFPIILFMEHNSEKITHTYSDIQIVTSLSTEDSTILNGLKNIFHSLRETGSNTILVDETLTLTLHKTNDLNEYDKNTRSLKFTQKGYTFTHNSSENKNKRKRVID